MSQVLVPTSPLHQTPEETPHQTPEETPQQALECVQFPNALSQFVFTRTYPRWRDDLGRRESYIEAVDRYVGFLREERDVPDQVLQDIRQGMLRMEVLPSMRAFWSSGSFARLENSTMYNCAFVPLDSLKSFSEMLYILMMGTGIGYSVEREFVANLPIVSENNGLPPITYQVPDTTKGWMDALYDGMVHLFKGQKVEFDYSLVRPAGSRLKTKGGRASGPGPLRNLLRFMTETIESAAGRQLTTVECNDIACMIGEIVMAGGVRRAALISFSDPDDDLMRDAKKFPTCQECGFEWAVHLSRGVDSEGNIVSDHEKSHLMSEHGMTEAEYLAKHPGSDLGFGFHRFMANNSAYWSEKPDRATFDREWQALRDSGSGERGFFMIPPSKQAERRSECRSNPCLTGDTLVAVADGRGSVTFRELAEADEDVPVYCYSEHREVVVRTMRAPRKTGSNISVFKVTLDDGSAFRATGNHSFVTREGVRKQVGELQPGDRLQTLNRWLAPAEEGQDCWWVSGGWHEAHTEHQKLTECAYPEHRVELFEGAVSLTQSLGRMATPEEWSEVAEASGGSTLKPQWRHQSLSLIRNMLRLAAAKLGFETPDADAQAVRDLHKWLHLGYDVELRRGTLVFTKQCEKCGKSFHTSRREHGLCPGCGVTYLGMPQPLPEHLERTDQQVRIYNQLRRASGEDPSQEAFTLQCVAEGISHAVSPRSWEQFEQYCGDATCIILSVEPAGEEDVYNGTVDEFHNFFIGGWDSEDGKIKFVNTQNCGEILLRYSKSIDPWTGEGGGGQFCNLSAAVMRPHDTLESFAKKVETATWIGAVQSSFTYFPNLRPAWAQHCQEDRLLGVDITGHCDNPTLSGDPEAMLHFNTVARETAARAASHLGIPMPVSITCGKPSGNSSQVVDCASGFHTRFAKFYIRRVRISNMDPLFRLVRDAGVPVFKDNKYTNLPDDQCPTWVVEFPVKSPEGSLTRSDETALHQLNRYLHVMRTWISERGHNQSATVYVRPEEWGAVGDWVFEHWDEVTGLSFLPYDGGKYSLAPYEEITEEEYNRLNAEFPHVDYGLLQEYEKDDMGTGAQVLACVGGGCEVDWDKISAENAESNTQADS